MSIMDMSFAAGLMIGAAVAIRAAGIYKLPKATFKILWLLCLARLLLPLRIESPLSAFAIFGGASAGTSALPSYTPQTYAGGVETANVAMSPVTGAAAVQPVQAAMPGPAVSPLFVVWLCVAIGLMAVILAVHLRHRRMYRTALPLSDAFIASLIDKYKIKNVAVKCSDRISSPLAYGFIRPVILIPTSQDMSDQPRLEHIILHELTHIKHKDTLLKLLLTAALCVHWFNPLVWVMYVLANRDIELACDDAVVKATGDRAGYARTLLSIEEQRPPIIPTVSYFSRNAVEERIVSIMKTKKIPVIAVVVAAILVCGCAAAFATSPPDGSAAGTDSSKKITAFIMDVGLGASAEQKADAYKRYEPYGLTYDSQKDELYYNGELVRFFKDMAEDVYDSTDGYSRNGNVMLNPDGTVDVHEVYEGGLTGFEADTQEFFDLRTKDIDRLGAPDYVSSAMEAGHVSLSDGYELYVLEVLDMYGKYGLGFDTSTYLFTVNDEPLPPYGGLLIKKNPETSYETDNYGFGSSASNSEMTLILQPAGDESGKVIGFDVYEETSSWPQELELILKSYE